MFDWVERLRLMLAEYRANGGQVVDWGRVADGYQQIEWITGPYIPNVWTEVFIGFYRLTPEENRGKQNLFWLIVDQYGERIAGAKMETGNKDQPPNDVVTDDKTPPSIPDIPIWGSTPIWIKPQNGYQQDTALNFHTILPDEYGPNGEVWNSTGHHSWFAVFMRFPYEVLKPPVDPPPVDPPPVDPPPVDPPPMGSVLPALQWVRLAEGKYIIAYDFGTDQPPPIVPPVQPPIVPPVQPPPVDPPPGPNITGIRHGLGICGSNTDEFTAWSNKDKQVLKSMTKIQHIKIMSNSSYGVIDWIVKQGYSIIARLYSHDRNLSAKAFYEEVAPKIRYLTAAGQNTFQVFNEPNHMHQVEGNWTPESFASWAWEVADRIMNDFPFSFLISAPMAEPNTDAHNGTIWLEALRPAIYRFYKGVGVHIYWQNFKPEHANHKSREFGERYKDIHAMFPDKPLYILEGPSVSNEPAKGHPINYDKFTADMFDWYVEAYHKDSYWRKVIFSTSPFIFNSPDPHWRDPFCWVEADESLALKDYMRPMCNLLR